MGNNHNTNTIIFENTIRFYFISHIKIRNSYINKGKSSRMELKPNRYYCLIEIGCTIRFIYIFILYNSICVQNTHLFKLNLISGENVFRYKSRIPLKIHNTHRIYISKVEPFKYLFVFSFF